MSNLFIVSTPIGNLEDITLRALRILFTVDYIACEDTRKTGLLLHTLKDKFTVLLSSIKVNPLEKPVLISYFDEVESIKTPYILQLLNDNKNIALVSDSGTPLIADPGFKLLQACQKEGIKIIPVPGASSPIAALSVSTLPPNIFTYLGFLPVKPIKRLNLLVNIKRTIIEINQTYIFLESPHRLKKTLEDMLKIFGDIEIVIARELTKLHEEILKRKISDIIKNVKNIKGELVVLFSVNN